MPEDDILNSERWVRLMCDYGADGVWDQLGRACNADQLPISDNLRTMIRGWQAWYEHDTSYLDEDPGSDVFDDEAHSSFGQCIAQLVKRELPDWTVIYFKEIILTKGLRQGTSVDEISKTVQSEIKDTRDT